MLGVGDIYYLLEHVPRGWEIRYYKGREQPFTVVNTEKRRVWKFCEGEGKARAVTERSPSSPVQV